MAKDGLLILLSLTYLQLQNDLLDFHDSFFIGRAQRYLLHFEVLAFNLQA